MGVLPWIFSLPPLFKLLNDSPLDPLQIGPQNLLHISLISLIILVNQQISSKTAIDLEKSIQAYFPSMEASPSSHHLALPPFPVTRTFVASLIHFRLLRSLNDLGSLVTAIRFLTFRITRHSMVVWKGFHTWVPLTQFPICLPLAPVLFGMVVVFLPRLRN